MVVGSIFFIIGLIIISVTVKGYSLNKKFTYIVGFLFAIVGFLICIFSILKFYFGIQVIIGLGIGSLFLGMGIMMFVQKLQCNKKIEATYVGVEKRRSQKGNIYYTPKFKFKINNKIHSVCSMNTFSEGYLKRKYKNGMKYFIYINPENPYELLTTKRISFIELSFITLGIIIILSTFS